MTPGAAITAAARRLGWDGDELADSIQVNRSMVASWIDGSEEPPARFHRRLEEALDFTAEELAALKGEMAPPSEEPAAEIEAPTEPAAQIEAPTEPEPAIEPPPVPEPPARRGASMSAGRAIREARRRKGWTTRELASAIHYRRSEVESWEDDDTVPWKFAVRAMTETLDFTAAEAAAVEAAGDDG